MTVQPIRSAVLAAGVLLASLAGASRAQGQQAGMMMDDRVPDATVETLDGTPLRISQLIAGKPALIEFWATWCPLCKELEPAMKAAQRAHGDSIVFLSVGVPQSQTPERQKAYVAEHMLGGRFVFDRDGKAIEAFHAPHTSYIVVVDDAGKVVYTGVGKDQDIEAALGRLHHGMMRQP